MGIIFNSVSFLFTFQHTDLYTNIPRLPDRCHKSVVDEQKSRTIFWHNLWKENGLPREGIVAEIRRVTPARYHYAIKCVKKR